MSKEKPTIVRVYREGWYHAILIRVGRKWAIVREFSGKRRRIAVADIKEALWQ